MSVSRTGTASALALDGAERVLRLDGNENPHGCSLLVQESLSIQDALSHRPEALSASLRAGLSRYTGRPPGDLHLANSPRELLWRVLTALVEPGDELIAYTPCSATLRDAAQDARVPVLEAPRVGGMTATAALRLSTATARTVYVGSPNDPTGDLAAPLEVVSLLRAGLTVVVDETYAEFTDKGLGILAGEFPNLISLRSFAPWAGLWGIPVSYAVASAEVTRGLGARWPESTVSLASRVAAGASLDDAALLLSGVRHIRLERARLYRRLRKLNFVEPMPSHGPFILCAVTRGEARRVRELLAAEGILVHVPDREGLPDHIRISVGTAEDTDRLIDAMCRISVPL